MVDGARLSRLRCRLRADRALPDAACKLGDIAADDLARHMVWIAASAVQPTEKMRQTDGVRSLRVNRAIALGQLSQELIA
jgi:hypothetical protein